MSGFRINDRVICVDATPIPIAVPGASLPDFSFPEGYIEEGQFYCVVWARPNRNGTYALLLAGLRVIHRGREIPWNSQRFRKVLRRSQPAVLARAETTPST